MLTSATSTVTKQYRPTQNNPATLARRGNKVFLCASGGCIACVHLHHQACETRGPKVLEWGVIKSRGFTHPKFIIVFVQCIKERLGTPLHEPSPLRLDALAGSGADVQAEKELRSFMPVLLLFNVAHKGGHQFRVSQAHLVTNEFEFGPNFQQVRDFRTWVLLVSSQYCGALLSANFEEISAIGVDGCHIFRF